MHIGKKTIPVDPEKMTAEINAMENGVLVISGGQISMYPSPAYGKIEISFQNYKHSRPHYDIVAD